MPSSTKKPATYKPEWVGPIEGYIVNFMAKHAWKVASTMEREDIYQEAFCVFLRCKRKYPHMDTPQHFMALFKRAWGNQFTDMANEDTAQRVCVPEPDQTRSGEARVYEPIGELGNDGYLAVMIQQAPDEIRTVLNLFLNAPQEIFDVAMAGWREHKKDGNGSAYICRILGLPPHMDVMDDLEEYFRP